MADFDFNPHENSDSEESGVFSRKRKNRSLPEKNKKDGAVPYKKWTTEDKKNLLLWIQTQIGQGNPPPAGVDYVNEKYFEDYLKTDAGANKTALGCRNRYRDIHLEWKSANKDVRTTESGSAHKEKARKAFPLLDLADEICGYKEIRRPLCIITSSKKHHSGYLHSQKTTVSGKATTRVPSSPAPSGGKRLTYSID